MEEYRVSLDEFADLVSGDLWGAFVWVTFLGLPIVGIRWLFPWQKALTTWRRGLAIGGIVLLGAFWLVVPCPFMVYALSRKVTVVRAFFTWVSTAAPEAGSAIAGYLDTEILPTPRIWHLLVAIAVGTVGYVAWRYVKRRRAVLPPVENTAPQAATAPPAAPAVGPTVSPPAAADPEVVSLGGLRWRKTAGMWQPLCPKCRRTMGVVDALRPGIVVNTGGATIPMAVARCSIPGCNAFQKELMLRGAALQRRVQEDYERQQT